MNIRKYHDTRIQYHCDTSDIFGRHDIAEILVKVTLNTINQIKFIDHYILPFLNTCVTRGIQTITYNTKIQ
jgi:predicted urease superfamily metal-dependent hydrolase